MKYRKGFTLIELLVVIAIIGILSSVVLASLNSARTKGQIAAIKSNLKNMIPQAELGFSNTGDYSTACTSVDNMRISINNNGGTASCSSVDNTRWAVSVKFNSDTTKNWTVDSNGVAVWDTSDALTGTVVNFDAANIACTNSGGRLPSYEQLISLFTAHNSTTPPIFLTNRYYWTNTSIPSDATKAWVMRMDTGGSGYIPKTNSYGVHCVR